MKNNLRFIGRHKWKRDGQFKNSITKEWMDKYICKRCYVRAVTKSGQKPKATANCAQGWVQRLMES